MKKTTITVPATSGVFDTRSLKVTMTRPPVGARFHATLGAFGWSLWCSCKGHTVQFHNGQSPDLAVKYARRAGKTLPKWTRRFKATMA